MGGRGASSSSGSRGGNIAKSIVTQGGVTVDLSKNPLRYGKNDSALSGDKRKLIEDFEKRRGKAKIEYNFLVDENGNVLEENKGGRGSVGASLSARQKAEVLTHNHPRGKGEENYIGGTFSEADLNNFTTYNTKTYRASANEGTYSITKGKNFDSSGFKNFYHNEFRKNQIKMSNKREELNNKYRNGDFKDYSEYYKTFKNTFNDLLVDHHNSLLAGQKQFGYTYTLERKK